MRVLFYSVNSLDNIPNLASELDLMQMHLDAGDEVVVLRCTGQLAYCNVNPHHWRSKCFLCQQSLTRGLAALRPGELHYKLPTVLTLSQVLGPHEPDYSILPIEFENMAALMAFEIDGINLGEAIVASVVSKTKEHKLDTKTFRREIFNSLKSAYLVLHAAQKTLETIDPDRVYFFNGRMAETRPFLKVCEKLGIPSCTIERAGDFGRYNLFENAMAIDLDYIKAEIGRLWNSPRETEEKKKEIGKLWFQAKRQGILTGDKYYGQFQQDNLLPEGFESENRNIAIFTTSEYEFAGVREWQNTVYEDQNDGILQIVTALQGDSFRDYQLWVRVHPNMINRRCAQLDDLKKMEAMNFPNFHIIWPDSPVNSYELMENADLVITFGSTLGVEATFWGKPSILAGRALYEDLNCCYRPQTHQELVELLAWMPSAMPQEGAIRYGYRMMRNGRAYRYFKQTGYYEGEFQGENFKRIPRSLVGQIYHYGLRKLDKLYMHLKSKSGL